MPGAFLVPLDIANRALDHVGSTPITSFTQDIKAAQRTSSVYDKLRDAELRRNVWRFSIRKVALRAIDVTTMFLVPATYNPADVYPQGSIVLYANVIYFADQYVPAATTPGTPNEAFWTVYFGPQTVTPWNPPNPPTDGNAIPFWSATVTYNDGAYVIGSDNTVYVCVVGTSVNQNPVGDNGVHWVSTGTTAAGLQVDSYYAGELVYNVTGTTVTVYQCLTTGTTDNPTLLPDLWLAAVTYNTGDTVTDAMNNIWQSTIDLNLGNSPVAGPNWEVVPANQASTQIGQNWLQINATVRYVRFQYPIGAGPRQQTTTRNIYRLPSGFLREAPQDPKQGVASYLGAPSGLPQDDWEFEGDFITTMDSEVIILRFVADVQDVTQMDPMFCEGLGARIGLEVCESLTQSSEKIQMIGQAYKTFMGDARAVNGIETGLVEPPLDDYIQCRI
jgi:hypothetical protein